MAGLRRLLINACNVPDIAVGRKATSNILDSCVTCKPVFQGALPASPERVGRADCQFSKSKMSKLQITASSKR